MTSPCWTDHNILKDGLLCQCRPNWLQYFSALTLSTYWKIIYYERAVICILRCLAILCGLYRLEASSTPTSVTIKISPDLLPYPMGGIIVPPLISTNLKDTHTYKHTHLSMPFKEGRLKSNSNDIKYTNLKHQTTSHFV